MKTQGFLNDQRIAGVLILLALVACFSACGQKPLSEVLPLPSGAIQSALTKCVNILKSDISMSMVNFRNLPSSNIDDFSDKVNATISGAFGRAQLFSEILDAQNGKLLGLATVRSRPGSEEVLLRYQLSGEGGRLKLFSTFRGLLNQHQDLILKQEFSVNENCDLELQSSISFTFSNGEIRKSIWTKGAPDVIESAPFSDFNRNYILMKGIWTQDSLMRLTKANQPFWFDEGDNQAHPIGVTAFGGTEGGSLATKKYIVQIGMPGRPAKILEISFSDEKGISSQLYETTKENSIHPRVWLDLPLPLSH